MAYLDTSFYIQNNEDYLDSDFIFHVPEYLETSFYLQNNEDYLDSDFQITTLALSFTESYFLFPGNYVSYRSRFFLTYIPDFEDTDFLYYVPDFKDIEFEFDSADYEDINTIFHVPGFEDTDFILFTPGYYDRDFILFTPDHEDFEFLVDVSWYLDRTFQAIVPYDEWEDIEFTAQTLGRGSGDFGYEYDEWSLLYHVPGYIDRSFIFNQDIAIYIDRGFYAVLEGVGKDVYFLIHHDITYGYVEPSFILINVTDNLVEQALCVVSSWVDRPGRRPAIL